MGERATSLSEVGVDVAQLHASPDGRIPCRLIHAILLEVDEVDSERPIS
jgi:hypothetical protein